MYSIYSPDLFLHLIDLLRNFDLCLAGSPMSFPQPILSSPSQWYASCPQGQPLPVSMQVGYWWVVSTFPRGEYPICKDTWSKHLRTNHNTIHYVVLCILCEGQSHQAKCDYVLRRGGGIHTFCCIHGKLEAKKGMKMIAKWSIGVWSVQLDYIDRWDYSVSNPLQISLDVYYCLFERIDYRFTSFWNPLH